MRGTLKNRTIQAKRDIVGSFGVGGGSTGGQASSPCDTKPNDTASRARLLVWLDDAGVTIDDPTNLTKAELWSFINDFCDDN